MARRRHVLDQSLRLLRVMRWLLREMLRGAALGYGVECTNLGFFGISSIVGTDRRISDTKKYYTLRNTR